MKQIKQIFLLFLIWTISSCDNNQSNEVKNLAQNSLFELLSSDQTGINFVNSIENQEDFNIFKYRNFYNGGGVAIGDLNNDGLSDIYFTGNMVSNKLYLNKGSLVFEDVTDQAGVAGNKPWSTGVCFVDINADGLLDIYVSNAGNMEGNNHDNDLYINQGIDSITGIPNFVEDAANYNLAKTGFTTHASFFDYDKDGDLDAYILNNSNIPVSSLGYAEQREVRAQDWEGVPQIFRGVGDMLLRNDNGRFVDVSEQSGIYGSLIGFGLGVMVTDINEDTYPDIYISNDFYERDYLYINQQDGTFSEEIKDYTSHLSLSAMGIDIADINNDGYSDIFITDMLPEAEKRVKSVMEFEPYNVFKLKQSKDFYQQYIQNTLQLNNGNGSFSEIAYYSGVEATDWSWAGLLFDMDNDGLRDIFITNGINHDLTDLDFVDFLANDIIQKMALTGKKESVDTIIAKMPIRPQPNYAYKNNGNLTFTNVTEEWGLELPSMSNGAAYGDLDNDGDLDIVVNNVNMPAFIYQNQTNQNKGRNYINISFKGGVENPFAVGALIKIYDDKDIIVQDQMPFRGFQSSMDYKMTIGLGDKEVLDSLRVVWPNGKTELLKKVAVNQTITLAISDAVDNYIPPKKNRKNSLLNPIANEVLVSHDENNFNDFDQEGLIYQLLSQEGPALAVADVNGDGNEDVFVGGAKGSPAQIYFHQGNGVLRISKQRALETDAPYEDTAAAFFDVDNDGDQDLMVGSGGNETNKKLENISRLYLNDGKGNFTLSPNKLPATFENIAVIAPQDINSDGLIDVFIGSRSVTGTYGLNPKHLFLMNTGDGDFEEATERIVYEINKAGMITDAKWADIDGDNKMDLITVSDWGTPNIYQNTGSRLKRLTSSLDSLSGWWQSVEVADIDKDGDMDLILGNQGSNIHYRPSEDNKMKLVINDFDNNGTIEQVMTLEKDDKDYPIHQKKEITTQMVKLKKQNLKASDYAGRSIDELFEKEVVTNSIIKEVTIPESVIALNQGAGTFSIKKLPARVQLSCICAINCLDLNNDGNLDLVMGGNNYEFKPQYSRLDASFGNVLLGDGNANFEWQDYDKSGFFVKGEIKQIATFKDGIGKLFVITAINDSTPKIHQINE